MLTLTNVLSHVVASSILLSYISNSGKLKILQSKPDYKLYNSIIRSHNVAMFVPNINLNYFELTESNVQPCTS